MRRWVGIGMLLLLTGCATLSTLPTGVPFFATPNEVATGMTSIQHGQTPGGCAVKVVGAEHLTTVWAFYIGPDFKFIALGALKSAPKSITLVARGRADPEKNTWRELTIEPFDPRKHNAAAFDQWLCGLEASRGDADPFHASGIRR